MHVVQGRDVDLISPFPVKELTAAVGWMHCYKTHIFGEDGPSTDEEMAAFLAERIQAHHTWAIVDKANLTKNKTNEVPIVGMIMIDKVSPYNAYCHVASNRRAWGSKLADPGLTEQGGLLAVQDIFKQEPSLTRLSIAVTSDNKAAINLAKRLGFVKDGSFEAMTTVNGQPATVIHFGLVKELAQGASNVVL